MGQGLKDSKTTDRWIAPLRERIEASDKEAWLTASWSSTHRDPAEDPTGWGKEMRWIGDELKGRPRWWAILKTRSRGTVSKIGLHQAQWGLALQGLFHCCLSHHPNFFVSGLVQAPSREWEPALILSSSKFQARRSGQERSGQEWEPDPT